MTKEIQISPMPPRQIVRQSNGNTMMGMTSVFGNLNRSYLNEYSLYMAQYGNIPNLVIEENIDCKRAAEWFRKNYADDIQDHLFSKVPSKQHKGSELDDLFFFLYDDLLVNFDTIQGYARLLFRNSDMGLINGLVADIKKFKKRKNPARPELFILINDGSGLDIRQFKINHTKINISENYNDDFAPVHQNILKRLSRKNDKGLVLLHGKPGTGKTNYIRHLIKSIRKDVLFMPPTIAGFLTDPSLLHLLIQNPNSVLVIEDAENIVMDREKTGQSSVSALLNLADGLLSDCLNIQVICSFNTDISKIDPALIRKGRLIACYEFKELETTKATALSQKLGFSTQISAPMTLTSIYNQHEQEYHQAQKHTPIGFNSFTTREQ